LDEDSNSRIISTIQELSDLIASFENGIPDQDVQLFVQTASGLKIQLQDRKRLLPLGQMILSLGKYLASNRTAAHQGTLPLLQEQLDALKTLITGRDLDPAGKNRLVKEIINKFKSFKEIIVPPAPAPGDLNELKAVVLSIDWEITNGTISQFNGAVDHLFQKWRGHWVNINLLKIMQHIVNYIESKKETAHTDSIDVLKSVYIILEKVVHQPGLSVPEKKQRLDQAIDLFNSFKKRAVSSHGKTVESGQEDFSQFQQDMPPALSHLIHETKQTPGDSSDVTLLDPEEVMVQPVSRNKAGEENIPPALQGKRSDSPGPGNVMDSLLNPKETEVDKMLDSIHLMDVNSTNPVHNPAAMAGADRELKPGMSQITRYDKQSEPIPEIEGTLNEFFGIDMDSDAGKDIGLEDSSEAKALQDNTNTDTDTDTDTDGVVPFDYEDEVDEPPESSSQIPFSGSDDATLTVIKGLEEAFCELPADVDQTYRTKILQDLQTLGTKWEGEPVKSSLIKIIGLLFDRLSIPEVEQTSVQEGSFRSDDQAIQPGTEPKQEPDITDSPSPDPDPQKGVLSKLKRFFRF
jgi:hypothetical protein